MKWMSSTIALIVIVAVIGGCNARRNFADVQARYIRAASGEYDDEQDTDVQPRYIRLSREYDDEQDTDVQARYIRAASGEHDDEQGTEVIQRTGRADEIDDSHESTEHEPVSVLRAVRSGTGSERFCPLKFTSGPAGIRWYCCKDGRELCDHCQTECIASIKM